MRDQSIDRDSIHHVLNETVRTYKVSFQELEKLVGVGADDLRAFVEGTRELSDEQLETIDMAFKM